MNAGWLTFYDSKRRVGVGCAVLSKVGLLGESEFSTFLKSYTVDVRGKALTWQ